MNNSETSGFPILVVATILLIIPVLAGCTSWNTSEDEGPSFTAWFLDIPGHRPTYQEIGENLQVQVRNEGDAGTEQVCIEVNGAETDCGSASLVPGEETTLTFEIQPDNGTHEITVLNASATIEVEPLPRIGEWINGSLVDLRVVDAYEANETSASWNWTVEARYHNESTELDIEWIFGTGDRHLHWDGPHTRQSWEGTYVRPIQGRPVEAHLWIVGDGGGQGSADLNEGLFRWRWPDGARTAYP